MLNVQEYASHAAFGRRLASGPFSTPGSVSGERARGRLRTLEHGRGEAAYVVSGEEGGDREHGDCHQVDSRHGRQLVQRHLDRAEPRRYRLVVPAQKEERRDGEVAGYGAEGEDTGGHDESGLTARETISNAAVLMFGGIETTEGMIANALLHLLTHPDQRALIGRDPSLVPRAVEESLRLEPAAAFVDRYATRDVRFGGADVQKGDLPALQKLARPGAGKREADRRIGDIAHRQALLRMIEEPAHMPLAARASR